MGTERRVIGHIDVVGGRLGRQPLREAELAHEGAEGGPFHPTGPRDLALHRQDLGHRVGVDRGQQHELGEGDRYRRRFEGLLELDPVGTDSDDAAPGDDERKVDRRRLGAACCALVHVRSRRAAVETRLARALSRWT